MQRIGGNQFQTGTIVTPEWFNTIQEELAGTIEGLGLILDPNNPNQLLEALMKLTQVQVGQTIESLGNPGDNFRPMGSTLLRASFPLLDAVMPTPNHDAISGGINSISAAAYTKIVCGNGVYVAVSATSATPIARSLDGINWTYPAQGGITLPRLYDLAWNGTLFVAVGVYNNAPTRSLVLTSPDGVNWTQRAVAAFLPTLKSVTWNGAVWCAGAAADPTVYTSPDGINWTQRAFPITPAGSLKIRSIGATLVALDLGQTVNSYWAQCYYYTSTDNGVTWTLAGISGGGNTIGTVNPNLSASPNYLIIQVGSNFYRSADGNSWTMFDPSITVNTIVGSAKVMPAEVHYAGGRYLSLGTSKLTDGSGAKLQLDVLLVSPDTVYWYGIQLKSLPDQLLFAGAGNFVVGMSVSNSLYTTLTFDPTKLVLNIPESNKYVRVK
jgi:hypothetical protein